MESRSVGRFPVAAAAAAATARLPALGRGGAQGGPVSSTGLSLLAVDDEPAALADLTRLLEAVPTVVRVEASRSAAEALLALAHESRFDGAFLDVRMPGLDGVQLARVLRRLKHPPALVFVSAYEEFALDAFELAAADYLMKPVSRVRLEEAVARVAQAVRTAAGGVPAPTPPPLDTDVLPVDTPRGGATRMLKRSSILYLQAHGDYVRVWSDHGRFLLRARLSELAQRWARHGFVRVHRGFVINLHRAIELRPQINGSSVMVMADCTEIPVARRELGALRRHLATLHA
jgi:DNA-binding LytR/AlgR family response regulator